MSRFIQNNTAPISNRERLNTKYRSACGYLLTVALFTVLNLFLQITKADVYFLFSASIPYFIVDLFRYYCGMYPVEFYEGYEIEFLPTEAFAVATAIAVIIALLYFVCFLLARKNRISWLIAGLVLFATDTVAMFLLYGFDTAMIIDIVFHVLVLVMLISGIKAYYDLKKLPIETSLHTEEDESEVAIESAGEHEDGEDTANYSLIDSTIIRRADMSVKARVLAEADLFGHKVIYRRVKKTNELVIDQNVYAEYTALFERSHMLTATLDGHEYTAGYDSLGSVSYIAVDGRDAVKKVRLI